MRKSIQGNGEVGPWVCGCGLGSVWRLEKCAPNKDECGYIFILKGIAIPVTFEPKKWVYRACIVGIINWLNERANIIRWYSEEVIVDRFFYSKIGWSLEMLWKSAWQDNIYVRVGSKQECCEILRYCKDKI